MDEISDRNLVELACAGDRRAYESLITRHYRRIYSVCLGIVADPHESQDLCQEAMLLGYVKLGRLRQAERFSSWMTEIAKNLCFDWLRKQKKTQKCIATLADDPGRTKPDTSNDIVTEAVAQLPTELRGPLVMYYFDGRNSQAISQQLGISHSSVWRRLRRAKEYLYEILNER